MKNLPHYEKEMRPWGEFERFTLNHATTVKIITVHAAQAFSLQTHEHRDEFWRVLHGSGVICIGDISHEAHGGSSFFIPRGCPHRASAGLEGIKFLEIAFGEFNEADIKRLEDLYGRS